MQALRVFLVGICMGGLFEAKVLSGDVPNGLIVFILHLEVTLSLDSLELQKVRVMRTRKVHVQSVVELVRLQARAQGLLQIDRGILFHEFLRRLNRRHGRRGYLLHEVFEQRNLDLILGLLDGKQMEVDFRDQLERFVSVPFSDRALF